VSKRLLGKHRPYDIGRLYRHCGPLPLSEIVVLATPAEILVGEAINKLKVISAERLNTAEHIAI